jgi:hypothetical protein
MLIFSLLYSSIFLCKSNISVSPSAAWHGTCIVLRRVSPGSTAIFDFIMELYASCSGDWKKPVVGDGITSQECAAFLEFAATFCRILATVLCVVLAPFMRHMRVLNFDRDQEIRNLCQILVLQSR